MAICGKYASLASPPVDTSLLPGQVNQPPGAAAANRTRVASSGSWSADRRGIRCRRIGPARPGRDECLIGFARDLFATPISLPAAFQQNGPISFRIPLTHRTLPEVTWASTVVGLFSAEVSPYSPRCLRALLRGGLLPTSRGLRVVEPLAGGAESGRRRQLFRAGAGRNKVIPEFNYATAADVISPTYCYRAGVR